MRTPRSPSRCTARRTSDSAFRGLEFFQRYWQVCWLASVFVPKKTGKARKDAAHLNRWKLLLFCMAGVCVGTWSVVHGYGRVEAEAWRETAEAGEAELAAKRWAATEEEFQTLLFMAENAAFASPEDGNAAYLLDTVRWRASMQLSTPAPDPSVLRRIADSLSVTRQRDPYNYQLCMLEGSIRGDELGESEAAEALLKKGANLSIGFAEPQFTLGRWLVANGKLDEGLAAFRDAVLIDRSWLADVVGVLVDTEHSGWMPVLIADDPELAKTLLGELERQKGPSNAVEQAREYLVTTYQRHEDKLTVPQAVELAGILAEREDREQGIALLRRSLTRELGRADEVELRLELARLLTLEGHFDEAMGEAKKCRRSSPNDPRVTDLLKQIMIQKRAGP